MREIKFRGKRLDTGEWVYGCYVGDYDGKHYITQPLRNSHQLIEVDPATVGQYTRLKDKNGKKIYEGDIVPVYQIGRVVVEFTTIWGYGGEVIGNIHDNPELLKEVE